MFEKLLAAIRDLSLTNVLILALIVIIITPTYFAYRFIIDEGFRAEFMNSARWLDRHVPCLVLESQRSGGVKRHTIGMIYGIEDRFEKMAVIRAPGVLTDSEIQEVCKKVYAMAEEMKAK
jgi:hypothetical protein